MGEIQQSKYSKLLVYIFLTLFLVALCSSFFTYLYSKDYDVVVEASCDQTKQSCYLRDCENTEECPPNNLSVYKIYQVKGYDYKACKDGTCLYECENGAIQCTEILCGENRDDICSLPPAPGL